jgi:SNF2 family DNA or RNA helicase
LVTIFDESSAIKADSSLQTAAARRLRRFATRAYLVNGSPINNNLLDLYAPFTVLDANIIGCKNWWQFRNRYCVMGGWKNKQIVGYQFIDHLQTRIRPHIIRRLKEDCLDLPPKLYNTIEVPLSQETWKHYKEFREQLITWLDEQTPIVTLHTIVKLVRLSQFCCGLAGGLEQSLALAPMLGVNIDDLEKALPETGVRVISAEKHDAVCQWFKDRCADQSDFKAILWTRFRKEQEILEQKLSPCAQVLRIYGGQRKEDRELAIDTFNSPSTRPVVLLGQPRAGGLGLNLQTHCSWAVYVSNDYSLLVRQQSEDRIHRAGQEAATVNYLDVLATGPNGQKTIDHVIKKVLEKKDELAVRTTSYWRTALLEE